MMFDEKSIELIKSGKKTVTRRVVRNDIRPAVPGHVYTIKVDRTSNTYGYIHIKKVKQEKWGMINIYRAKYEGFDDVEEYKKYFYSINGKIDNNDLVWVIEFKYIGDKMIEEITIPKKQYCLKCDECDFNINSGLKDHICFNYEFWNDDVLANKERHFVDAEGHVYSMTSKENGGFGGQGYDVELADNTLLKNIGLWHRGEAPSSVRKQLIRGERTPVYRR